MYKILVVDDEKNIRLGIKAIIERNYPAFEVENASDGQEALEIINKRNFDILITDIKMPRMDGITLIQKVKDMQNQPALIILSGHDDFSFAKEAIKCKVTDYLLKPVKREELFQTIDKAIEEIEKNEKLDIQQLNDYRKSQLNYILLNPNISEEEITELCTKMKLTNFFGDYYIGVIHYQKKQRQEQIIDDLLEVTQLYFNNQNDDWIYFIDSEKNLVIITETKEVFNYLKDKLSEEIFAYLSMGISDQMDSLQAIKKGYEQARTATKYKFLYPRCVIFQQDEFKNKKKYEQLPIPNIKKISNMLGTDRENEIKALLLEVLNYKEIVLYQINYIEALSTAINTNIFDAAFHQLGEESIEIFQLYDKVGDLYQFDNFHEYYYRVENLLIRLHHFIKEMKTVYTTEEKYMEKAIRYIRDNFHKDLNMAVVSNYISLNYSYFSHSFKEYTGKSFVDYLKKVRVEHAKKLLGDSENKIFEVSENVGFKNPKQFARVFRELEGISPKEFREKI